MTKYNNIKSISINSLSKNEINDAIKEWAENDNSMEKLLWSCYNNGVETTGCHAGNYSYLSLRVNNSKNEVIKLLDTFQKIKDTKIIVYPDGGNPFSGEDWYKPELTFCFNKLYKDETDKIFDLLAHALNNREQVIVEENFFSQILKLYDFFAYKESGLTFDVYYTKDDFYKFAIKLWSKKNQLNYFNNLFSKCDLTLEPNTKNKPFETWYIKSKNLEEIISKTKNCINYIINNYSMKLPNSINELTSFPEIALLKKREFGNSIEGKEQFRQWLANEREKFKNS